MLVAGRGNLEDSRRQDALVADIGIMQGIEERWGSDEKHCIWNWRDWNVPSIKLSRQ